MIISAIVQFAFLVLVLAGFAWLFWGESIGDPSLWVRSSLLTVGMTVLNFLLVLAMAHFKFGLLAFVACLAIQTGVWLWLLMKVFDREFLDAVYGTIAMVAVILATPALLEAVL